MYLVLRSLEGSCGTPRDERGARPCTRVRVWPFHSCLYSPSTGLDHMEIGPPPLSVRASLLAPLSARASGRRRLAATFSAMKRMSVRTFLSIHHAKGASECTELQAELQHFFYSTTKVQSKQQSKRGAFVNPTPVAHAFLRLVQCACENTQTEKRYFVHRERFGYRYKAYPSI